MKGQIQEYVNDAIIVRFDPRVCIHSGVCLRGLHFVFDVKKRPWINVEAASADPTRSRSRSVPPGRCRVS